MHGFKLRVDSAVMELIYAAIVHIDVDIQGKEQYR